MDRDVASIVKVVQEWMELWETVFGEIFQHTFTISVVGIAMNNTQKEAISSEVIFFVLKLLYLYFVFSFTGDIPH